MNWKALYHTFVPGWKAVGDFLFFASLILLFSAGITAVVVGGFHLLRYLLGDFILGCLLLTSFSGFILYTVIFLPLYERYKYFCWVHKVSKESE